MLTHSISGAETFFAELREREFARLDSNRVAYLDYAGGALYALSQIDAHRALLARGVFGNHGHRTQTNTVESERLSESVTLAR